MKDKKKVGLVLLAAAVLSGVGAYGFYSTTKSDKVANTPGGKDSQTVVTLLKETEHEDTIEKTIDADDESVINRRKEPAQKELSEEEVKEVVQGQKEEMGVVALAMSEQFSNLFKYESMSKKELEAVDVADLNSMTYWFVWYSQYVQVATLDGNITSAADGLDRLAIVYAKAGKESPYDVYADGFKIKVDNKNWESYKPADFDEKVASYREQAKVAQTQESSSDQ